MHELCQNQIYDIQTKKTMPHLQRRRFDIFIIFKYVGIDCPTIMDPMHGISH